MVDDNKNQDFIETDDDFVDAMDENFGGPDDPMADDYIIDGDAAAEPLMPENEWADDFDDDMDADFDEDADLKHLVQKPERNWFNIALFGAVGLVILGVIYSYLPGMLGNGGSTAQPQGGVAVQNQELAVVASPEQNALLAQQALGTPDDNTQITSLLDNPDLLGDGVASVERADPEAADNEIFEALGDAPQTAEGEIENIFDAIDDLQTSPSATIIETQAQQLPIPADQMLETDEDSLLEAMAALNTQEPRSPYIPEQQSINTGIATVAEVIQTPLPQEQSASQDSVSSISSIEMTALNERMDLIMTRLESLATQIENISDSQPVLNAPTQSDGGTSARLENMIQNLEKRIETLANQKQAAAKPTPKKATPAPKKKSEPAYVPPKKTPQWELRGASPNEAYVAEKGSQNLRTVKVGSTLDGIGRITSIAVENGQWVVRGTSGRITQ